MAGNFPKDAVGTSQGSLHGKSKQAWDEQALVRAAVTLQQMCVVPYSVTYLND